MTSPDLNRLVMPRVPTSDPQIYSLSLAQLKAYKTQVGRAHAGRFVQIFLGLKFYQNAIPSVFSNQFISTEVLQTSLDDLYARQSRPADDCVLMLFEGEYLPRTGVTRAGNRFPQNTWRNNFNLQKGIGCYASPTELSSRTFLAQSRLDCSHLVPQTPGVLAGATCGLSQRGAAYRNEDHPKWLRVDPGGNGFAVGDLLDVQNFEATVAPGGNRIPILPLIVALYHDALPSLSATRPGGVDVPDFMADFSLSQADLQAYFDSSVTNPFNAIIISATTTYQPQAVAPTPALQVPRAVTRAPRTLRVAVLPATPVAPPAVNTGWSAEEYAKTALTNRGWTVHNVSRQQLGYDLLGQKARRTVYFEVKSSLGYCTPRLTEREWQQAVRLRGDYVLTIIENFNPIGSNSVYWVPDPVGALQPSVSLVKQYGVARSSWQSAAVDFDSI